jgi:hypothetical protein
LIQISSNAVTRFPHIILSYLHSEFEEMAPQITLYFLQASRCIRTAWQLHELGLDYTVKFSPREGGLAPPAFRKEVGGLGKFPTLVDGDVTVTESGNIAECVKLALRNPT